MKMIWIAALWVMAMTPRVLAQTSGGADLFEDRCVGCHFASGGGQGPPLTGVVGRKAGSVAGFAYTPAMKASGLVWTAANLDRFLADPAKLVPGTSMPIQVPDAAQRAAILNYLATGR